MIIHEFTKDVFTNIFSSPVTENTVTWIIISGIIGGIITQILKYFFENSLPEWKKRRATRIAIQKYDGIITMSAFTLANTIKTILNNRSVIENDLEKLSILYNFGCFFGWIKIFFNESSFEEVMQIESGNYRTKYKYQFYLNNLIYSFSYDYLVEKRLIPMTIRSLSIPKWVIESIGELMIDKVDTKNAEFKNIINFLEFRKKYEENSDFKICFKYLENWINNPQNSRSDIQNNILIILYIHTVCFYLKKKIKVNYFPSELIPLKVKNIFYIMFWLPKKIFNSLYLILSFIEFYRFDANQFKSFLKSYTEIQKKGKERNRVLKTNSFRIENEIDHLKYYTMGVYPHFNFQDVLLSKSSNVASLISLLFPFFNYRFLSRDVFNRLKHYLEYLGYTDIINSLYEKELNYIKNFILRNNAVDITAEAWNIKGLILTYLIKENITTENLGKVIDCYEKSWKLNNNIDSVINKGLLYLELCHSKSCYDHDFNYNKAKECFEKALELNLEKQNDNKYPLIDIWNDLGITNYCLGEYDKAKECFEKALELNPEYKFAEHNKKITHHKMNNEVK